VTLTRDHLSGPRRLEPLRWSHRFTTRETTQEEWDSCNLARSQMAAGLLRVKASETLEARSAGKEPAEAVHPLALKAMKEVGIHIPGQQPRRLPVRHLVIVSSSAMARTRSARACSRVCSHATSGRSKTRPRFSRSPR